MTYTTIRRSVGMTDELWEAVAALADRNGRSISEEIRCACQNWLALAGNINVDSATRKVAPIPRKNGAQP